MISNIPVRMIEQIDDKLGTLPTVSARVISLTSDPECSINELGQLIMSDTVITSRLLSMANCAANKRGEEIRNLRQAMVRLGLQRVRNVALCIGIHDLLGGMIDGNRRIDFWKSTFSIAETAEGLACLKGSPNHEDAYLISILSALGNIVFDTIEPEISNQINSRCEKESRPVSEIQTEELGFNHKELTSSIMKSWNLPAIFSESIIDPNSKLYHVHNEAVLLCRSLGVATGFPMIPLNKLQAELKLPCETLDTLAQQVDYNLEQMYKLLNLNHSGVDVYASALTESREALNRVGLDSVCEADARVALEDDLVSAREIQQKLLPTSLPKSNSFSVAVKNIPSRTVSGDFYDFLTLADGRTCFVIADITGKGIPAAMLASNLQSSLRSLAPIFNTPGDILRSANKALFSCTDYSMFATVFMFAVDSKSNVIEYASAGHCRPLVLSQNTIEWLDPDGTPLGMLEEMKYPNHRFCISPNSLLVLYTDGITEGYNNNEMLGESGLLKLVNLEKSVDENCDNIINAISEPEDDMTLLIFRLLN